MKILFYFGHPAQFLFAKNAMHLLEEMNHEISILIKSKDVLQNLLEESNFDYRNILPEGRSDTKKGMLLGLLKRDYRICKYAFRKKFDLMVGTDPSLAHVGKLFNIPVITVLEDDIDVIPRLAKTTYPFTTHIFAPRVCIVGKEYEHKKLAYDGYMKLAYLHPNYFSPDKSLAPQTSKPYVLIRLAKLTAHHDEKIQGLDLSLIDNVLELLGDNYDLLINSEYTLPMQYQKFCLKTKASNIHHVMNFCYLFISDSQSMTVEAGMLGIPSIRYSDFSGRISILNELEKEYGLTVSIKPPNLELLINTIALMLNNQDLKKEFQIKRDKMLVDKIDVTAALVTLLSDYPNSLKIY